MGHSMVSRGGDPESDMTGLNIDLRLITGRMAQTLNSYEGKTAKYASDQIRDVESRLDEIDNPILKVQIKDILSNYKVWLKCLRVFRFLMSSLRLKFLIQILLIYSMINWYILCPGFFLFTGEFG